MQTFQTTLNHLDLFSYIGGFSGAGGMLVLGDRKLDPKTDYNGVFADPAEFAKKVHLLWLGVGTNEPERIAQDSRDCTRPFSKQTFTTFSTNYRALTMSGRLGVAI